MRILLITFILSITFNSLSQNSKNIDLVGSLGYAEELNDVWGYVDTNGNEYALVGTFNGLSIVDVSVPSVPQELFFIPGANSSWRDIKVWDGFAYITNENSGGLAIVDLQYLPDSIKTSSWNGSGNVNFSSSHNIFIDEKGYGYIVGANYGVGGAIIVDLFTTPGTPILKTVYNLAPIHDLYVRNDTMWNAEINNGWFAVVDIKDKSGPTVPGNRIIATHNTPNNFTHNTWLSDNGDFLFTTDEKSDAYITAYDVSDLGNIHEVDRIQSSPGFNVIPHNTFVKNNFLVTSYYRDGTTIVDANRPGNLIETGYYDSSPFSGNGFNGVWGTYPYLPSGHILSTDIEEGLFVLFSEYVQGCYLEGIVSDSLTGNPLNGVEVEIINENTISNTGLIGDYATGLADSGTYPVMFSKFGFKDKTIPNVVLKNGVLTLLDVDLKPLIPFSLSGTVLDSITQTGIKNAFVNLSNSDTNFTVQCDANGNYTFQNVFEGAFNIIAGNWGHISKETGTHYLHQGSVPDTLELIEGIYDDFTFDFNWQVTTTASTGDWVREEPIGTYAGNAEINPENDVSNDLGNSAYITGNGGGGIGFDDVDNGNTILSSPVFDLTSYLEPHIQYYKWFVDASGVGALDDTLLVYLYNGTDSALVDKSDESSAQMGKWERGFIRVEDYMSPTSQMQLRFYISDLQGSGHVVEAGVDYFRVIDSITIPPIANFGANITVGCSPVAVQFSDSSEYIPNNWVWELPGSDLGISNDQNPMAVYSTPGKWTVKLKVLNQNGQDSLIKTDYVEVFENPVLTTGSEPAGQGNQGKAWVATAGGMPPYQIQWSGPQASTTDTVYNLASGTYLVTVTDALGCESVDSAVVSFISSNPDLRGLEIIIHPNPFAQSVYLDLPVTEENINVEIFNAVGSLMYASEYASGSYVELDKFGQPGIYFIKIRYNGKEFVTRLIKTG